MKTFGRKRHILVDASGLILLACIRTASLHDTVGARQMIEAVPMAVLPRLELVWAEGACTGPFAIWLEKERSWRTEVSFHRQRQAWRYGLEKRPAGFHVLPRRLRGLLADDESSTGLSLGSPAHVALPGTMSGCQKPAWR
nr:transposase [Geminicoccus roseus]